MKIYPNQRILIESARIDYVFFYISRPKMSSKEEINDQLDELAMQLLLLCQNLVDTKLLLEKFLKEGFIGLAQSRYAHAGGPNSISKLQLPTEDWEPFEANKKVSLSQCMRQEIGVKFNYLSLEVDEPSKSQAKIENLGSSELVQRGPKKSEEKLKNNENAKKRDPLKWFGVLLPNSMKQSQKHFSKAIELTVEATNIQNEIRGILGRRQVLMKQLKKLD